MSATSTADEVLGQDLQPAVARQDRLCGVEEDQGELVVEHDIRGFGWTRPRVACSVGNGGVVNLADHAALPRDTVVEAHELARVYGEGDTAVDALRGVSLGVERRS